MDKDYHHPSLRGMERKRNDVAIHEDATDGVDCRAMARKDGHDGDDENGRRGLPRFPLTGTVHLVALFTKELARSCEAPNIRFSHCGSQGRTGRRRVLPRYGLQR